MPVLEPGAQTFVDPTEKPSFLSVDEPLTGSEMRVLRYLPTQLTAPEIARQLFLSVHTVTTHTRHIYAKLGVHRRHEAVDRARARGLLAPIPGLRPVADQPARPSTGTSRRVAPPPSAWGSAPTTATVNSRRTRPAPRCPRIRTGPSATATTRTKDKLMKVATVTAWRSRPASHAVTPIGERTGSMLWPAAGGSSAGLTGWRPGDGSRGGLDLLGGPFVASVAYVGPGNPMSDIRGAAPYGQPVLWVVRGTNLMMVVR
jgi:DNA-binding CsgD family transcriptional regulator